MSTPASAGAVTNSHQGLIVEACNEHSINKRRQLIKSLRGSKMIIPDLQLLMKHWPAGVNDRIQELHGIVEQQLETVFATPKDAGRLEKMKNSGVALFGASWWAKAPLEALRIGTYLSIWLFAWDDETDSFEFSSLVHHFERASAFRKETIAYIEASLVPERFAELPMISKNPLITNFKPVGEAIALSCSSYEIETFLKEIRFFIEMTDEEQRLQMTQHLPTVTEYYRRRMGSSAVRVCLAITQFAYGIDIPPRIMKSDAMEAILQESNIIISTSNDILSIKKEVAQEQVDTLIPLLTVELGSVQSAVDEACEEVRRSIQRFDKAEAMLLKSYENDGYIKDQLIKFIDGCKFACTANLNWSLISGRYKIAVDSMVGGLQITL